MSFNWPGSQHIFPLGALLENPKKEKHLHHYHECQKKPLAQRAETATVAGSRDAHSLKSPDLKMNQTSFNFASDMPGLIIVGKKKGTKKQHF